MQTPTADDLADIPLFAELDAAERATVADWLEVREVAPGERLTHQGASGYAFFVLRDGAADVVVDGTVVSRLTSGEFFGEISLVEDGRQTATVQVTEPSVVLSMFGTRYRELELRHPDLAATLRDTAAQRHNRTAQPN